MKTVTVLFIAVGLAMDAFAVSIASGLAIKQLKIRHALRIGFFFGLFQALMPVVGWLAGLSVRSFIENIDHWIAFGLLSFIGCRMIWESFKMEQDEKKLHDPLNVYILLMLSVATSIDALAVGVSFAFLNISIAMPVIMIGIVTFLLSCVGVFIGDRAGHFFERKIEILGGVILICIGIIILVKHLI